MRNDLAVLAGGPQGPMWYLGAEEAGAPPGYTDWQEEARKVGEAVGREGDASKAAVLTSALGVAKAAGIIPVAGWIIAGVGLATALLGVKIKGRTTHVPRYPDANSAGVSWAEKQWAIYRALPPDAQAFMVDRMYDFNVHMFEVFGHWWNAVALRENPNGAGTIENFRAIGRDRAIKGPSGYWLEVIMASADATSVEENVKTWYFDNYESYVLKPLDQYMLDKYKQTLQAYVDAGGKLIAPESAGLIGVLAVAAIGGALLMAKKKGRR